MKLNLRAVKCAIVTGKVIHDKAEHQWKNKATNEVVDNDLIPYAATVTSTVLVKRSQYQDICIGSYNYINYRRWCYNMARLFDNQIDNANAHERPFKDIQGAPFNELLNASKFNGLINGDCLCKIRQDFTEYVNR